MGIRDAGPAWGSQRDKHNGPTRHGQQQHCQACERQGGATAEAQRLAEAPRSMRARLLCERLSRRGLWRAVGVSLRGLFTVWWQALPPVPRPSLARGPLVPRPWDCAGWQPKPMRGGVGSRSRPSSNGAGLLWLPPPARAWRFLWGSAVVRVPKCWGRRAPGLQGAGHIVYGSIRRLYWGDPGGAP